MLRELNSFFQIKISTRNIFKWIKVISMKQKHLKDSMSIEDIWLRLVIIRAAKLKNFTLYNQLHLVYIFQCDSSKWV